VAVDPIFRLCLDAGLIQGGVEAVAVPLAGTGPVTLPAIGVKPIRDQLAEFPELRPLVGAQEIGWEILVPTADYPLRFVPGDRLTLVYGTVHEVRGCRAHPSGPAWVLETFLVEPDDVVITNDGFMLPFYFAGTSGLGL
jgi:hypothetical protein